MIYPVKLSEPSLCKHYAWTGIHTPEPAHYCTLLKEKCTHAPGRSEATCDTFAKAPEQSTPKAPDGSCVHLGAITGMAKECCGGKDTPIHECAVRGTCLPLATKPTEGITACVKCTDRQVAGVPKPERIIKIDLPKHYNCSLIEWRGQTLLATRLDIDKSPAQVHLSELDEDFKPIWTQHLVTEYQGKEVHAEDPRFFVHRGELHLSFTTFRDKAASVMYARLSSDLQVEEFFRPNYPQRAAWEKNWMFFSHDDVLHSVYLVNPHTILRHDKEKVELAHRKSHKFRWQANMRGGASPVLIGGEWYHFFHTMVQRKGEFLYSMGLYTFENKPPFALKRVVNEPLLTADEDRPKGWNKSVVYPCGAVLRDGKWYVSYGHQDKECRIAVFDAKHIESSLRPLVKAEPPSVAMPSTWVITCRETPERGQVVRQHFAAQNMKVNFFEGLHGRTWGIRASKETAPGEFITSGHIGLDITYWALWQTLLRSPGDEFLIFEDDAVLVPGFADAFHKARKGLPDDWQFCYVGHLGMSDKDSESVAPGVVRLNLPGSRPDRKYPHGTQALLVRRSALETLLRNSRANHHFDVHLALAVMPKLKAYAFVPSLASQRSYSGEWKTSCGLDDDWPIEAIDLAIPIPGWMSKMELQWLHETASSLRPGSSWVEIGACHGRSTVCVALSLPPRCTLHVVDGWDNLGDEYQGLRTKEVFEAFQERMEMVRSKRPDLKIKIWKVKDKDDRPLLRFRESCCDVAFIDGDHSQEAVTRDMEDCMRVLKQGGILSGHDYRPEGNEDVIIAVDRMYPQRLLHDTIWHLHKQ